MKPSHRRRPEYSASLGRAIKLLRTEQQIERRDLAESAGISYSYLAEIENGNKPPSTQVLVAISEALGLRPHQLHATADSLSERRRGETLLSPRLAQVTDSLERAWAPNRLSMIAPSPNSDRRELVEELVKLAEGMTDEDVEIVLELARRLGR